MESKFLKELARKSIHIFGVLYILAFIILSNYIQKSTILLLFTLILIFFLIIEYFRIKLKKRIPFFWRFWRKSEENKLAGHVFFSIGVIISFTFLDFRIASAAILMLIFGDMAGALIGVRFGKTKIHNKKSLQGSLAELIINLIIGFIILKNIPTIIIMALAATLTETFIDKVDDNLTIPVFSGFLGQITTIILKATT